jgi:hypothetical protein
MARRRGGVGIPKSVSEYIDCGHGMVKSLISLMSTVNEISIICIVAAPSPRPRAQHFPAFLAVAGRPLLPSMIDYSVFSQLAAARGSIISGPVSRTATAFNFLHPGPNSA